MHVMIGFIEFMSTLNKFFLESVSFKVHFLFVQCPTGCGCDLFAQKCHFSHSTSTFEIIGSTVSLTFAGLGCLQVLGQ